MVVEHPMSALWVREASWTYWTEQEHAQWRAFLNNVNG